MLKIKRNRTRVIGLLFLLSFISSFALTDGPTQPEYETFVPVGSPELVNLATGDFNYSIDLLSVPTGSDKSYPINLNYSAGIGPEQEASWVGLGWNLNEGVINRNVVNIPDDYQNQAKMKLTNTIQSTSHFLNLESPFKGPGASKTIGHTAGDMMGYRMVSPPTISITSSFQLFGYGPVYHYDNGAVYNGNFKFQQYGFLYNNIIDKSDRSIFRYPNSLNFSPVIGGPKDRAMEWDDINANPFSDPDELTYFPVTGADIFTAQAHGLAGTFKATRASKVTQVIPHSGFSGSNRTHWILNGESIEVVSYGGTHYSWDNDQSAFAGSLSDFKFVFADAKAGEIQPAKYYPNNPTRPELPQPEKVFPKFGAAGTPTAGLLVGFSIVDNEGNTFDFDQPVYVYSEYNEIADNDGTIQTGEYSAKFIPDAAKTGNLKSLTTPLYASQFLLTSVTGPDFIDKDGNGKANFGDKGYWVTFQYKKGNASGPYCYRMPFSGKGTSTYYEHPNNGKELKYSLSYGSKDIYFLNSILTDKSVVLFNTFKRKDGYESGNLALGGASGVERYSGLGSISMFDRDAFDTPGADGFYDLTDVKTGYKEIRKVTFRTDYSLAKNTPNSSADGRGKLTLKEVQIEGKSQAKNPPYVFDYAANPNYGTEKWDRWGYYKSDGAKAAPGFLNFPNHSGVNPDDAKAWSLSKIHLPSGGSIGIEYESDKYNYIHNRPIGTTIPNIGEYSRWFDNGGKNIPNGKLIFSDHLLTTDLPSQGDDYSHLIPESKSHIYEIRNHAPGYADASTYDQGDYKASPFYMLASPHYYDGNVTDADDGQLIRRMSILKNELPEGMNLTNIQAYAYAASSNDQDCDKDVRLKILIKGITAAGVSTVLNPSSIFNELSSPQWRNESASGINPSLYVRYDVELWARDPSESGFDCEVGIRQRDMRVFVWDAGANHKPRRELSLYGGGLRVKSVTIADELNGPSFVKKYFYDSNGDGTGINTGVLTKEPPLYNSANNDDRILGDYGWVNAVPESKVYYGKVTVVNPDLSKSQSEFLTPITNPTTITKDLSKSVKPNGYLELNRTTSPTGAFGCEYSTDYGHFHDYWYWNTNYTTNFWGTLSKKEEFEYLPATNAYKSVGMVESEYESRAVLNEETMLNNGTIEEAANGRGGYMLQGCVTETMSHNHLMPRLKKVTSTQDGVSTVTEYEYSPGNGEISKVKTTGSGKVKVKEIKYAFEESGVPYSEMGHKETAASTNKNMLIQVSESHLKYDDKNDGGNYVGADVSVWGKVNGSQITHTGSFKWRSDSKGQATKPVFPWANIPWNSNDANWVKQNRMLQMDESSHPVDVEDAVGVHSTKIYGYGNRFQTGFAYDMTPDEGSTFTGDYDTKQTATLFDAVQKWEKAGSDLSDRAHFGKKSVHVVNAFGPSKNVYVNTARKRPYRLSAWIQHISGDCALYFDQRNASFTAIPGAVAFGTQLHSPDKTWRYYEVKMESPSQFDANVVGLRGFVGCPDGGEAYIDDIRFTPIDVKTKTTFFDPDYGKPIAIVDENNVPRSYEYDGLGRLTGIRNQNGLLVGEHGIQQKFNKPAFSANFNFDLFSIDNLPIAFGCYEPGISAVPDYYVTDYEILSSTPAGKISVSPDKKKLCIDGTGWTGEATSQVSVKFSETGEVKTFPARFHEVISPNQGF